MTSPDFDKESAEPDIIDNRAHSMAGVLNMNLDRVGFLDVSSGYFEVSGYGAVPRGPGAGHSETVVHLPGFS